MSRRSVIRLLGGAALVWLALLGYWRWQSEAVVGPYHAVALGMPLDDAERVLGAPRDSHGGAYELYERVHVAEDDAPRGASNHVQYREGGYLVTFNYDPTVADQRVHRKTLIRVRYDWVRRLGDSLR
jgi:hypothetical protein